jgi:hypothetical protein
MIPQQIYQKHGMSGGKEKEKITKHYGMHQKKVT